MAGKTRPIVIGLYGVSGCGKSYLINQLKEAYQESSQDLLYLDGSAVIDQVVPGGLQAFKSMTDQQKNDMRIEGIYNIRNQVINTLKPAIVSGHHTLLRRAKESIDLWDSEEIWTPGDEQVYSYILYLNVDPQTILENRKKDKFRPDRDVDMDINTIARWQQEEMAALRQKCFDHKILFVQVRPNRTYKGGDVKWYIDSFISITEQTNEARAIEAVDSIIASRAPIQNRQPVLVFDADKTLAEQDTGSLFWESVADTKGQMSFQAQLKRLFTLWGYSFDSFRQAALYYEELPKRDFHDRCNRVARNVRLRQEIRDNLLKFIFLNSVQVLVLTCGLRRVWEDILRGEGLANHVHVLGVDNLKDGFIMTGDVKGAIVSRLRKHHGLTVSAFGDSPLDIPMLLQANRAFVVVGPEQTRSSSMDGELVTAIEQHGLKAKQIRLPQDVSPRLTFNKLPEAVLSFEFFESLLAESSQVRILSEVYPDTAKILMTPMRDARLSGHSLRQSHRRVGCLISELFLPGLLGLEKYEIPHVLENKATEGYRILDEEKTLIVPLMRGGEPMAFGVSEALPKARFVHAKMATDLKQEDLEGIRNVVLVDSVINNGASMVEFVEYLQGSQKTNPHLRKIVMISGVVQDKAIRRGKLAELLREKSGLSLIALRTSENKYSGKGVTDTGHRLFNTTHLD